MTSHTTHLTASIPADQIEQAHDHMLTVAQPDGDRFFSAEPNRTGTDGDYLIITTVARPDIADAYRQTADEIDGMALTPAVSEYAEIRTPALPAQGEPVEAGNIYADEGGGLWMARQSHSRSEHAPFDTPALWMRYRDAESGDRWIAAEDVEVGEVRSYDGEIYRVIQAHVTQEDWTPDATPAMWELLKSSSGDDEPDGGGTPDWEPGITVEVGDLYTYEGSTYRVIQGHTTQAGWEPPNVPALWDMIVDVNTSPSEDLQTLDGVGPTLAERIIDDRPYSTVDDLTRVDGVSQSMVDGWGDEVTV